MLFHIIQDHIFIAEIICCDLRFLCLLCSILLLCNLFFQIIHLVTVNRIYNLHIRMFALDFFLKSCQTLFCCFRITVRRQKQNLSRILNSIAQLICDCFCSLCIVRLYSTLDSLIRISGVQSNDRNPILCCRIKLYLACILINTCDS